jgi:hypothetical protein
LLEGRGLKNVIHVLHCGQNAVVIAHIANEKLDLVVRQRDSHVFLFLLVATEDTNFLDVGRQESA